jgi:hypothetical protein
MRINLLILPCFWDNNIVALSTMNVETKWGVQVVASVMVIENGQSCLKTIFSLAVWMGAEYFGTAHLQDDWRVELHRHVSKKKGGFSWVWLVVKLWPFFCWVVAYQPWLKASFGSVILGFEAYAWKNMNLRMQSHFLMCPQCSCNWISITVQFH